MATNFLAPDPVQSTFFIPGSNTPGNGVKVFFYAAGTNTKQTVLVDQAGSSNWTNPIVLDSGGNLPSAGMVWFQSGLSYKVVWAPSNDTDPPASPYRSMDNLTGINDVNAATTSGGEWTASPTATFVSANSFSLVGDQTAAGSADVGRRMKFVVTSGTVYGVIKSAVFSLGITTVTLNMTNGQLDAGLSSSFYSIITAKNPSVSIFGGDAQNTTGVASATTTDVWNSGADFVHVTGTNTIASFGVPIHAGAMADVVFDSALTISSTATLKTIGGGNMSIFANDIVSIVSDQTSTRVVSLQRFSSGPTLTKIFGPSTGVYTTPSACTLIEVDMVAGGQGGAPSYTTAVTPLNGSTTAFSTNGLLAQCNGGGTGGTALILSGSPLFYSVTGGDGGKGSLIGTTSSTFLPNGGSGGTSYFAGGGTGGNGSPSGAVLGQANSANASSWGAGGGGGGANSTFAAGDGGAAGGYLKIIIPNPASSYSYTSGAGGNRTFGGGISSSSGAGAPGVIFITEYYL